MSQPREERNPNFQKAKSLTNTVFDGRIESINNSWSGMGNPIGFVHWFPQFIECIIRSKDIHTQHRCQIIVWIDFQFLIITFQLLVIHNFIRIANVCGHRFDFIQCRLSGGVVHPWYLLQYLLELLPNAIDHFKGGLFRVLTEMFTHVQRTHRYGQAVDVDDSKQMKMNEHKIKRRVTD